MKYYNSKTKTIVGLWIPKPDFLAFSQVGVIDPLTNQMHACTGRHDSLVAPNTRTEGELLETAQAIEQAQLYSKAPEILKMLKLILNSEDINNRVYMKAIKLVREAEDLSDPINRLLGKNAIGLINEAVKKKKQ